MSLFKVIVIILIIFNRLTGVKFQQGTSNFPFPSKVIVLWFKLTAPHLIYH